MIGTAHENQKAVAAIRPKAVTSTQNGLTIDTRDFEEALAILNIGAVTGTSPTLAVTFEESDDSGMSGATTIAGAAFTSKTASAANKEYTGRLNLKGTKRYVRPVFTVGGTSPSFTLGAELVLSAARDFPVSQVNSNDFSV